MSHPPDRPPRDGLTARLVRLLPLSPEIPPATQLALGVSVLMYVIVTIQTREPFSPSSWSLFRAGANLGPWTLQGGDGWRLLTYASLHGGLVHLGFNGYVLFRQAPMLERLWSSWRFCWIYAVGAIAGGLASAWFTKSVSIGASGALFAVFGGLLIELHFSPHPQARQQRNQVLTWIGIMLGIGFFAGHLGIHIDNAAHIGGLVGGLVTTWSLRSLRANATATRLLRGPGIALFALLLIAPLVRAFQAHDLPVHRGENELQVMSTLRGAWPACRDAALSPDPTTAIAPCKRFRTLSFDRPMGYLFLSTVYGVTDQPALAAREKEMLAKIQGSPVPPDLLPPAALLPLQAAGIEEALWGR
jgi:membrane associated rhomboid family serine protease